MTDQLDGSVWPWRETATAGRAPALAPALTEGQDTSLEKRVNMIRSTLRKHRVRAAALAATAGAALIVLACETPIPSDADLQTAANFECLDGGQIREAVAAGTMTAQEGQALHQRCNQDSDRAADGGGVRSRLGGAVRQGWITREQAGAIYQELNAEEHRLQEAVAAGEMTREEASRTHMRLEFRAFGTKLRERVAAGEMTAEEGRAAAGAYRELIGRAGRGTER